MTSKGSKKGTTGTEPNTTNGDMTRVDGVVLPEYRLPALKRDLTRLVDENASFDVMQPVFANLLRCYEEATGVDLGLSRETIDAYATHVVNIATTQPENNRAPLVVYEGLERLTEETVIPKIMEGWTNSSGTMPFDEYLELMKGPAEFIDAAARQLNVEYVAKIDTLETELTGARTELDVPQATYEESLAAMEASDDSELQIADPEEMQILKGQLEQVTSDYDHAKTRVAELATKLGVVKGEYTEYQNVAQTRISGLIDEVGKLAQKEAYANQLEQKLGEAEAKNVALETSSDEKSTGFRDVLAETRNNYLTEAKKVAELGKALAETSARLKEAESNYQTEINNAQLLETKFDDVDARVTELEILLQETENEYQANWQIIEGNLQTALGNLEIAQQNHEDLDLEFSVHRDETDILLTESGVMALRDQYRQLEVDFERLDRGYDTLEEKSGKEIVAKQNEIDSNEAEISSLKASRSNWKF